MRKLLALLALTPLLLTGCFNTGNVIDDSSSPAVETPGNPTVETPGNPAEEAAESPTVEAVERSNQ